jgi:hypothetical protein
MKGRAVLNPADSIDVLYTAVGRVSSLSTGGVFAALSALDTFEVNETGHKRLDPSSIHFHGVDSRIVSSLPLPGALRPIPWFFE